MDFDAHIVAPSDSPPPSSSPAPATPPMLVIRVTLPQPSPKRADWAGLNAPRYSLTLQNLGIMRLRRHCTAIWNGPWLGSATIWTPRLRQKSCRSYNETCTSRTNHLYFHRARDRQSLARRAHGLDHRGAYPLHGLDVCADSGKQVMPSDETASTSVAGDFYHILSESSEICFRAGHLSSGTSRSLVALLAQPVVTKTQKPSSVLFGTLPSRALPSASR